MANNATSAIAIELIAVEVHSENDISNVIRKLGGESDGGLFVLPDSHNVVLNAMEPWFALAFWGGAVVMLFGGAYVALARGVSRGR